MVRWLFDFHLSQRQIETLIEYLMESRIESNMTMKTRKAETKWKRVFVCYYNLIQINPGKPSWQL